MSWSAPQWAWLLVLPVLLSFFLIWAETQRRKRLEAFVSLRLADKLVRGAVTGKRKAGAVLIVLACLLAVVALTRPTWGHHWEEVPLKGRDLYVLLDVSRSMLAQDVSPDRITWAKRKILDLAALLPGDRIGILAFSGNAFLACPLTSDSHALPLFLDSLGPESTTGAGTAISSALDLAAERLGKQKSSRSAVLLLSDGEDHDGGAEAAAKRASEAGVSVFIVGVGKPEGAPIPERGGGFKKTRGGEMVITRLDENALQTIARAGGGAYWRSQPGDADLQAVVSAFSGAEEGVETSTGKRAVPDERFQWPLVLVVVLLLLEAILQDGLPRFAWRRRAVAALLALGFFSGFSALGADLKSLYEGGKFDEVERQLLEKQVRRPDDPDLLYDLGHALYRQNKFAEAEKAFASAAEKTEGQKKAQALYNRGNAAFRQNRFEEAIGQYETTLAIDPKDEDARHNLTLAKKRLQEQQKKDQPKDQQKDSEDKKDKKEDKDGKDKKDDKGESDQKDKDSKSGEEKKSEQGQGEKQDPEKEAKEKEAQAKEQEKDSGKEKGQEAQPGEKTAEMSKEEAQAWLSRLREKRNAKQGKPKPGGTPGGKDW